MITGEASESTALTADFVTYTADIETSNIEWIGARPASQHNGIVGLKDGHLKIINGEIAGGEFVIDLENIVILDITDPVRNARLKRHLESDDFFDVPNHPVAVFEITGVSKKDIPDNESIHEITGNLLMRGINRSITFDASVEITEEQINARSVQFLIDRTEWGVNYQSKTVFANIVDNFILDELALVINLKAYK